MNNDSGISILDVKNGKRGILDVKSGKRSVSLEPIDHNYTRFNLSICRNGWQTTVVEIDRDMVYWLGDIAQEMSQYIEDPK